MSNYKSEKYSDGKYMIYSQAPYPVRIGHVVGAKSTWVAERGPANLGSFPTKKAATAAIIAAHEWDQINPQVQKSIEGMLKRHGLDKPDEA